MARPKLYLAGPITQGDEAENFERFAAAHHKLMSAGFAVLNPGLTMKLPEHEQHSHFEWLECCMPWVDSADVLVRLPGSSLGAAQEQIRADLVGVQVLEDVDQACELIKNQGLWCQGAESCPDKHRVRWPEAFGLSAQPCALRCTKREKVYTPPDLEPGQSLTQADLVQLHQHLCQKACGIMTAKNDDYANPEHTADPFANFRASLTFDIEPELALLIRVQDKLKRLQSFVTRGDLKVTDESWQDACLDVINYMVLCAGLLTERAAGNI